MMLKSPGSEDNNHGRTASNSSRLFKGCFLVALCLLQVQMSIKEETKAGSVTGLSNAGLDQQRDNSGGLRRTLQTTPSSDSSSTDLAARLSAVQTQLEEMSKAVGALEGSLQALVTVESGAPATKESKEAISSMAGSTSVAATNGDGTSPLSDLTSNLTRLVERGPYFINPASTCHMSTWIVVNGAPYNALDCKQAYQADESMNGQAKYLNLHMDEVQPYDTIHVPTKALEHFVTNLLPNITVPVVILTSQYLLSAARGKYTKWYERLYKNERVVKIFVQNPDLYGAPLHDKLAPLPLGIQHQNYKGAKFRDRPIALDVFKKVFLENFPHMPPKNQTVFAGYLDKETNRGRSDIPSGPKLSLEDYYKEILHSKFVLSPSGHKPECYRHYEAIGFGAIPVTQLDPKESWHLRDAPVVYNHTGTWFNLTTEALVEELGESKLPPVSRNMVFEEYWMQYIETTVGRPLRWWDRKVAHHTTQPGMLVG